MKTLKTTVEDNETSVELDLFEGMKLKKSTKKRIQDEVGQYLVEQTLVMMNEKKSPVQGAPNFAPLSKNYKKKKKDEVGSTEANLEFDGVMKDEIDFERTETGINIGVFGDRAPAADGHNNLSGKSKLPRRQFLPDQGQSYKRAISKEVERIIADIVAEEVSFKDSEFKDISNKKQLYDKLKDIFGDMTRSELALAAFRNPEITDLIKKYDLGGLI